MAQTTGIKVLLDKTQNLADAIFLLATSRVMVGVPGDASDRGSPISNASLAYIHENGSPAANIPARPFLKPTIKARDAEINARLKRAGELAFEGRKDAVARELQRLGMETRDAVKMRIRSNIPPPLALRTVMGRIYRRKSKQWRAKRIKAVHANIAAGVPPQTGLFTALIDTGQLINAINYVVRKIGGKAK